MTNDNQKAAMSDPRKVCGEAFVSSGPLSSLPTSVFVAAMVVISVTSILKGLRLPNLWAVTQLTYNYSHGFVRRGFIGELVRLAGLDRPYRYNVLAAVCFAAFALCILSTVLLIRKAYLKNETRLDFQLAAFVFAASPGMMIIAQMVGYLDNFGMPFMLILLLFIGSRRAKWKYGWFYIVAGLSIPLAMIHESLILMFFPTMLFAALLNAIKLADDPGVPAIRRVLIGIHFAIAVGICLGAAVLVSRWGTLSPAEAQALKKSIAASSAFTLRDHAFVALLRSPDDAMFSMMPGLFRQQWYRTALLYSVVTILPGFIFLIYCGTALISRIEVSRKSSRVIRILFIGTCLSPLTMHLLGFDMMRWNAIAVFCSFCNIVAIRLVFPISESYRYFTLRDIKIQASFAAVVIPLSIAGGGQLYDGAVVQLYPYESLIDFSVQWAKDGFTYIPKL